MKQNWKRTLQGALLGAVLLAMAGCGSNNVMDTYSFGHQVIRVGQSEINHSKSEFAKVGATIKEESVALEGASAKKLDVTVTSQGQIFRISQYVFLDHGVLWNIVYQYPEKDQVGADISKEIQNKIQVTQQKEG